MSGDFSSSPGKDVGKSPKTFPANYGGSTFAPAMPSPAVLGTAKALLGIQERPLQNSSEASNAVLSSTSGKSEILFKTMSEAFWSGPKHHKRLCELGKYQGV